MAKRMSRKAKRVPEDLSNKIEKLKKDMGVEDAEVYVIDLDDRKVANAMQVGARGRYIFISSYLLKNLNLEENLAVIAHELAHIKFRHVAKTAFLVYPMLIIGMNIFVLLPLFPLSKANTLLLQVVAIWIPILFIILGVPIIRRSFETQADVEAAKYVGSKNMISALEKLSDLALIPRNVSRYWNLWHPSIDMRIKKLYTLKNND